MLTATIVLVGALSPSITATMRHAEYARALADMADIGNQALTAGTEMNQTFTINGTPAGTIVEIVVSDGDIPRDLSATGTTNGSGRSTPCGLVDVLERHLSTTTARATAANAYTNAVPTLARPY